MFFFAGVGLGLKGGGSFFQLGIIRIELRLAGFSNVAYPSFKDYKDNYPFNG